MVRSTVFILVCFLLPSTALGQDYFNGSTMKVGQTGTMYYVRAHVIKIIDDNWMIVNIEDVMHAKGKGINVLVKVSTKDLVDDQKWYGSEWQSKTGHVTYEITQTKVEKNRKYFVLEPKK